MNISGLSIKELKELLSKVESDLSNIDNEHQICNNIAKSFSGKQYVVEYNKKLKADIQIQLDILEFMNNGGIIKFADNDIARFTKKNVRGARAGKKLYKLFNVA